MQAHIVWIGNGCDDRAVSEGLMRGSVGRKARTLGDGWQRPEQAGPKSPSGGMIGSRRRQYDEDFGPTLLAPFAYVAYWPHCPPFDMCQGARLCAVPSCCGTRQETRDADRRQKTGP